MSGLSPLGVESVHRSRVGLNGWTLSRSGGDEDKGELGAWDHKDLAIEHAKELAKQGAKGQVIVHGEDGTIQDEFTYGDDPRNIPG